MNQQRRNACILLGGLAVILGIGAVDASADVTGSFTTHIVMMPAGDQSPASEVGMLEFDLQNEIDLSLVVSGFRTTFHGHFGLAGVEDVILTMSVLIGSLDVETQMVFGRFDDDDTIPDKDQISFIKKRVTTAFNFGGVTLKNLAIFEDTNFPQTPEHAFGDVMTISGQTISGVSIKAQSGICADTTPNAIKKHTWSFSVVPECHQEPKPDLLYTYEKLTINGIPISSSITGKAVVECIQVQACELTQTILVSGGIVPLSATFTIEDLFTFSFGTATLTFSSGPGSLSVTFDDTGDISQIGVQLAPTINPDTNPATLDIDGNVEPGAGLTSGSIGIEVTRGLLTFEADANFTDGPPATFDGVDFSVDATIDFVEIEATLAFEPGQMVEIESFWTVNF